MSQHAYQTSHGGECPFWRIAEEVEVLGGVVVLHARGIAYDAQTQERRLTEIAYMSHGAAFHVDSKGIRET